MEKRCFRKNIIFMMVARYSFAIERAKDKTLINLRALEEKRQCFSIFCDVKMSTKSKTEGESSRVSFSEIP